MTLYFNFNTTNHQSLIFCDKNTSALCFTLCYCSDQVNAKDILELKFKLTIAKDEHKKNFYSSQEALHKKRSFPLKISSVNVSKSSGNYGFGHIY